MPRWLFPSVAAALTCVLLPLPAHAAPEASQFTWRDMTVIDAKDMLSSWPAEINHGKELGFTFQNTVQARDFVKKGFRIRFFRADASWNPMPYQKNEQVPFLQFPPCDIYLSGVWPNAAAQYGELLDKGWLSTGPTDKLEDGKWLLIFEMAGGPNDGRILRLNRINRTAYFAMAAKLTVKANNKGYTVADLPKPTLEDINDIRALKAEAAVNAMTRYCMHLQKFAEAKPKVLAKLTSCATDAIEPG